MMPLIWRGRDWTQLAFLGLHMLAVLATLAVLLVLRANASWLRENANLLAMWFAGCGLVGFAILGIFSAWPRRVVPDESAQNQVPPKSQAGQGEDGPDCKGPLVGGGTGGSA